VTLEFSFRNGLELWNAAIHVDTLVARLALQHLVLPAPPLADDAQGVFPETTLGALEMDDIVRFRVLNVLLAIGQLGTKRVLKDGTGPFACPQVSGALEEEASRKSAAFTGNLSLIIRHHMSFLDNFFQQDLINGQRCRNPTNFIILQKHFIRGHDEAQVTPLASPLNLVHPSHHVPSVTQLAENVQNFGVHFPVQTSVTLGLHGWGLNFGLGARGFFSEVDLCPPFPFFFAGLFFGLAFFGDVFLFSIAMHMSQVKNPLESRVVVE